MLLSLKKNFFVFSLFLYLCFGTVFSNDDQGSVSILIAGNEEVSAADKIDISTLDQNLNEKYRQVINDITQGFSFLFEDILDFDFLDSEQKIKATYIKNKLERFYNQVYTGLCGTNIYIQQKWHSCARFLLCLVEWQRMVDSKFVILEALSELDNVNNFPGVVEIQKLRLNTLGHLYERLTYFWALFWGWKAAPSEGVKGTVSLIYDLNESRIDNQYITDLVFDLLPKKLKKSYKELIGIDFYNLWPNLYSQYLDVLTECKSCSNDLGLVDVNKIKSLISKLDVVRDSIMNGELFYKKEESLANKFAKFFKSKKDSKNSYEYEPNGFFEFDFFDPTWLESSSFTNKVVNFLEALILRLVDLQTQIESFEKSKKLAAKFSTFNSNKKKVFLLHSSLMKSSGFSQFRREKTELAEKYLNIVQEYLDNSASDSEKLKDSFFVYRGLYLISDLKVLKKQSRRIWGILGIARAVSLDKSVLSDMETVLTMIFLKVGDSSLLEKISMKLINKLLDGEISLDKIKGMLTSKI